MTEIRAIQADITTLGVDAIVNAANVHLQHGGGVALAIARAGGPEIQAESDAWVHDQGPLSPRVAAVTTAGDMPARFVIHVAGPVFEEGRDNEAQLRTAVSAALDAAVEAGARSVALPAISAGIYGYPVAEAAAAIADQCARWCGDHTDAFDEIILVGYDTTVAAAFTTALQGTDRT
jgi:O-acetyl-ADP-ribose deacetylase (regulator of RNase III)